MGFILIALMLLHPTLTVRPHFSHEPATVDATFRVASPIVGWCLAIESDNFSRRSCEMVEGDRRMWQQRYSDLPAGHYTATLEVVATGQKPQFVTQEFCVVGIATSCSEEDQ